MSNPPDVAQAYFNAWNAHDSGSIADLFTDKGEYCDPNIKILGRNISEYVQSLWEAFPDLSFEIVSKAVAGNGMVAAQWLMKGTNEGSFRGLPATGKKVMVAGADFIKIANGKIESVVGYYDSNVVPEQLGLQVLVQPDKLGPFSFGYSVLAQSGKSNKPGAFAITGIWNKDEETPEIRDRGRDTVKELLKMEGFIGAALARAGERSITVTAWNHPEDVNQILQSQAHNNAKKRFWDNLAHAAYFSVWVPHHINPMWVRCRECKKMISYEKLNGQCSCGSKLPDPPPYF
jgi:steroid delta-isomerase-like uncharacterized protein